LTRARGEDRVGIEHQGACFGNRCAFSGDFDVRGQSRSKRRALRRRAGEDDTKRANHRLSCQLALDHPVTEQDARQR
jgi:hypothetical protein